MQVYAYDRNGFYMCPTTAQKDPMQPGKFLMPAHATDVAPPTAPEGKAAKWDGKAWSLAEHPAVTAAKIKAKQDADLAAKLAADQAAADKKASADRAVEAVKEASDERAAEAGEEVSDDRAVKAAAPKAASADTAKKTK